MKKTEIRLLEEAYLSVSKKITDPSIEKETVTTDPNETVDVGSMDEPAPGVDMNMIDSEVVDVEPEDKDATGIPVTMSSDNSSSCGCDLEQEDEEDQMVLSNLDSIRESIMKIASFCGSGGHLDTWAQQKLAISMDNLAEVARRSR